MSDMTREEAIEALTSKDVCNSDIMLEALDIAIEALEQESDIDKYLKQIDHLHRYISKLETQIIMQEPCGDANANQHISNALNDVGQRKNALEGDAVSREVYNQVVRERDIAIEQLNELGYEFGEKIEPSAEHQETVTEFADRCRECGKRYTKRQTGRWIEHPEIETSTPKYLMFYECSECGNKQCFYKADTHRRNYCCKCGCRMIETQEGSDEE